MLDSSGSLTQMPLRPLSHVKVADTNEVQTKFYKFGVLLGRGTFGTVMKGTELKTGSEWAIKVINKAQSGASSLKLIQREINILRAVNHPHIIYLERIFESPNTLFLVFELCLGELREVFTKKKVFTDEEARTVVCSLASAVSYLHRNDIVHRDLKLENILVSTNPSDPDDKLFIKVTDFGLSVVRGGVGHESMLQELCGTPAYMSPELFGERMYSQQCDVWAMGVIMYLLLTGNYPFEARGGKTLAQVVQSQEPNYDLDPFKADEDSAARKLLRKMLEKNPAYRATASEVQSDPWTRGSQGEESAAKNAMELMRLWRQDMRQPSFPEADPRQRQSVRRLSIMLDAVRTTARVSDERARNVAIRKTFGELSPSGSVTILTTRGRRSSSSGDSGPQVAAPVATAAQLTEEVPKVRRSSSGAPAAQLANVARRRSGTGRSPRLSAIDEIKTGPAVKMSWEVPARTTTGALTRPGAFGVVGRERNMATSPDTTSTANLMPADKAPPIVYYERTTNHTTRTHRKKAVGAHPAQRRKLAVAATGGARGT